jgi:hypothetical protein
MLHTCASSSGYDPSCEACRREYARNNATRCAPIFPQPMTWTCERCGQTGYVGNETHRCDRGQ